jgi:PAS domain S-box-containing protein
VWFHDESVLINDDHGRPLMWQGVMVDITERMEIEVRLREAEEKFRTIVEQNQAIFYTQEIDPETGVSHTNYIAPGNTDLIGYSVEDVLADPGLWSKIIHPDDRARVLDADRESNTGGIGEEFSLEYRVIHKSGRIVWVQDEARLVQIGDAEPYWQGFLLEITQRKEAEERLADALDREREATQRLRSLDEMKNTFLAAVSHELRSPLTSILGLSLTLERHHELEDADREDLLERLSTNARKLDRLLKDLLDIDRLNRGIVAPQYRLTDVGALARRAADSLDSLADRRIEILTSPVVIDVDPAKVERIVENLLVNAARHTEDDRRIWLRVAPNDGGVLIAVEDDGAGVPAELRDAIFEPFRQGPTISSHSPGTGIGLSLVARFAELHGGRAWVEEREGGGASFRVFLPGGPTGEAEGDEGADHEPAERHASDQTTGRYADAG